MEVSLLLHPLTFSSVIQKASTGRLATRTLADIYPQNSAPSGRKSEMPPHIDELRETYSEMPFTDEPYGLREWSKPLQDIMAPYLGTNPSDDRIIEVERITRSGAEKYGKRLRARFYLGFGICIVVEPEVLEQFYASVEAYVSQRLRPAQ